MITNDRTNVVRLGPAPRRPTGGDFVPLRIPAFVDEVHEEHLPPQRMARTRSVSGPSRLAVFLLIPLLILQPFVRVYAEELPEATSPTPSSVDASQQEPSQAEAQISEIVPTTSDETGSEEGETNIPAEPSEGSGDTETGVQDDSVSEEENKAEETPSSTDEAATSTEQGGEPATSTKSVVVFQPEPEVDSSVPEETLMIEEPVSDSSEVTIPEGPSEQAVTLDAVIAEKEERLRAELRSQIEREFTKGCVSLDGVGYYCLKPDQFRSIDSLAPSKTVSAVSAEQDPAGTDKEIFAVYAGERVQLTANAEEDAFPAKDFGGRSVVWQGMRGGRWQIFFASFASGTPVIVQVTNGSENNFHPRVEGETLVWQAWMDGNWEVVMARPHRGEPRKAEELPEMNRYLGINPDWDVTRISMNPAHDMFPSITSGIVTWQRFEGGGWAVYAYSIETSVETRISDAGAKSENARFTLVYEEEGEDGKRRMIGYDVATGERVDLTEAARRTPERRTPYVPEVPVDGSDQAALPASGTSSPRISEKQNDEPGAPPPDL